MPMAERRILVPVSESRTLRRTVAYLVDELLDPDEPALVHLVVVPSLRTPVGEPVRLDEQAKTTLDHTRYWLEEDAAAIGLDLTIEETVLGHERPIYSPLEVAELLLDAIDRVNAETILFDPGYHVGLRTDLLDPLERILREESTVEVVEAPVAPVVRRSTLPTRADVGRYLLVFGVSFGFYLLLAGLSTYAFVSGLIAATLVTAILGSIALWQPPAARYVPGRIVRGVAYLPYLMVMIIKANFQLARVIFDPAMPIDPKVVRYHPAVPGAFPFTTLANSITLTPGTLSMRVHGSDLLVHTLTDDARQDLLAGRLERAVRFVFFGRFGARIASPIERGDITVFDQPEGRD